jgi:MFS family permease
MSKATSVEPAEKSTPDSGQDNAPVPARVLYATYAVGFASNSLTLMLKVLVPLWAAGVLPVFLAIHGGSLMDRLGTRRVTLVFAVTSTILCGLYPVLPFVAALFLLQVLSGLTTNMGWVGAQALIVQFGRGNTGLIAKFSLAARVGTFIAPVMIGVVWDLTGAWGAFSFCALWSLTVVAALLMVPKVLVEAVAQKADQRVRLADLVPRRADYVQAFAMIAIPAVAFIVATTYLRIGSSAMQGSFYVVYLEGIGMAGTLIGFLIAMSEGGGLFGISFATKMERIMAPHWVLLLHIALSLFFISITPFLGGIFILLLLASGFRGSSQGLSQPVMFAILSRAVSPRDQGMSIGLRTTVNRLASMMVPTIMGFVVEATSIEMSFVIMGGVLIVLCGVVGLVIRRIPGFST